VIRTRRPAAGFTLIEAIVAMVLTGILAGVVMTFMVKPVQSYFDSVSRAELTDAADVALRRITRDVRRALPNSLRVTTVAGVNYIEFIMTSGGGRYRDIGDGSTCGNFLYQTDVNCPPGATQTVSELDFDVLGPMPSSPAVAVGDFIVVFNLGSGYEPGNAYQRGAAQCDATPVSPGCNIAAVTGIAANVVTLDANPFAVQSPPLPSPDARFQVVPGGVRAVTYACSTAAGGNLTRQWNYGFNVAQAAPPVGGTTAVLATNTACTVEYAANATGRNGLLYVQLTLTSGAERAVLSQQIHVDNAP
jgi:MSHA biogenesis protein MshO